MISYVQQEQSQFQIQIEDEMQNSSVIKNGSTITFLKAELKIDRESVIHRNKQVTPCINHNRIEQLEKIGKGRVATVYRGYYHYDKHNCLQVAIKQIFVDETAKINDKLVRQQLINDLRIYLHQPENQFLVKLYGCFYINGDVKQIMEYMNFGSLENLIQVVAKKKHIQQPIIAQIAKQILEGLSYLKNKMNIIHRDIKPDNILLNLDGKVKIADFGISRLLEDGVADTYVATSEYMAPQMAMCKQYGVECDIWGFGLIIYKLATGKNLPYVLKHDSPLQIANRILNLPSPSLSTDEFSIQFCDFVKCCLQKDPIKRATSQNLLHHSWLIKNLGIMDMAKYLRNIKK